MRTKKKTKKTNNDYYRSLSLRLSKDGAPSSLDEENRSVEVLASTENPVDVFDWSRWENVSEILLMSGLRMASRQVPLLDSHSRYNTSSVIGSFRGMETGQEGLTGRALFSAVDSVEDTWTKVREGHLTDFSVGYRINSATWVEDGQTAVIDGREFTGPVRVVTDWQVKELSVCPIGADEKAKARAERPQPQKEEHIMDKATRAFLERQGLAKDATDEQAQEFLERMEVKKPEPAKDKPEKIDVDKLRSEATAAERGRINEIQAMGRSFNNEELATTLIGNDTSVDAARKAIMDADIEKRNSANDSGAGVGHRVEIGVEAGDKFRAAVESSILFRAGVPEEKPAEFDDLAGRSLVDIARLSLGAAGERSGGNPLEMVGRAMVTGDFPIILANIANKSIMMGWERQEESWQQWCGTGQVSDFKTNTMSRAGELGDLEAVGELGEYQFDDRKEQKEEYSIATYGKKYAISRQAIINDDLGLLTDTPAEHGEAAARKIGDLAYQVLFDNAAMGDGTALFHADHSNLGSAGIISKTTMAEAILNMKLQKDIGGKRRLNIRPVFYLAPVTQEENSEEFFNTTRFDATGDTDALVKVGNPYAGSRFTRIYEPRLDDNSTTAWYMLTTKGRTVVIFFLNGVQTPYMEMKQGWNVDGVEYKVRIDAGAKAKDWKGMSKNAGA